MRTAFVRAVRDSILTAIKSQGPTVLCGLAVGFALVAFWQQLVTGIGTDPGVQFGMGLGLLLGTRWGLTRTQTPSRWSHITDWCSLAAALGLWPIWITTLMDGLDWLPTGVWHSPALITGIGAGLALLVITVPVALLVRVSQHEARPPLIHGGAVVIGILLQTVVFGPSLDAWLPALLAIALCGALAARPALPIHSFATSPNAMESRSPSAIVAVMLTTFCLGIAAGCVPLWLAELWPVTAVTTQLAIAAVVLGGVITTQLVRGPISLMTSTFVMAVVALLLFVGHAVSVDVVLWQNASLTTSWQWEAVRALELFAVWGIIGGSAALLWRSSGQSARDAITWGGPVLGLGLVLASGVVNVTGSPRGGFALAACVAWITSGVLAWRGSTAASRSTWSLRGGAIAALVVCVWQYGLTANTARSARLLFSTTALVAHRSGWEPRLLERLDDSRLVSTFPGRHGAYTVWQNKGGEWHLRENGVPVGAISTAPAWYPQFAPEAAAALWPLVLVDQPERVLLLGAGSGAGLRTCAAFPIPEVICHEADTALIDWIQGPLAKATGYNPFADRCRWVAQPPEWLALPAADQFDVIVSSPRTPAQQIHQTCYTSEYYHRAARHLSDEGVFCQRFSGIDLGPRPLLTAVRALQTAFPETACLEVAAGEYLLLAAKSPAALLGHNLPGRLENRVAQVAGVLGWDWSFPLNLPAYDGPALREAADELHVQPHSLWHSSFAFSTPFEMMRWDPKLHETATVLSQPRVSAPRFPLPDESAPPALLETATRSRKSRYLEWLGAAGENPETLRRLAELAGEHKLIRDYPDTHWWEYRKELREQLQDHPRTKVQPVKHKIESPSQWHSEDRRRKLYFETLGDLAKNDQAAADDYQSLASVLEPHDPLLTLFGHQELAELLSRRDLSPGEERWHRLHAIYYAPTHDASVRNVVAAIDRCVTLPDTTLPPAQRFDELNGLLQTLRGRWESRNQRPSKAAQVTLQEIERSQLAVERALEVMEPLSVDAGYTAADWTNRKEVIERLLLRPFRAYREELTVRVRESEARTKAKVEAAEAGL